MARREYQVSEASLPVLESYADLPRNDRRRTELFSFLAEVVAEPGRAVFEQDEEGLRWTWLSLVTLVWRMDHVRREIDVICVWDEEE